MPWRYEGAWHQRSWYCFKFLELLYWLFPEYSVFHAVSFCLLHFYTDHWIQACWMRRKFQRWAHEDIHFVNSFKGELCSKQMCFFQNVQYSIYVYQSGVHLLLVLFIFSIRLCSKLLCSCSLATKSVFQGIADIRLLFTLATYCVSLCQESSYR